VAPFPTILLPNGIYVVNTASIPLNGNTLRKLTVSLDKDGDGFDDGSVKSNGAGKFSLPATLGEGLNQFQVRVSDSLGQQKTTALMIRLDNTPRPITNVALDESFQLPGAAEGTTTARTVSITGITRQFSRVGVGSGPVVVSPWLADELGNFALKDVPLAMGTNIVTFSSLDRAGNIATTQLTVTRVKAAGNAQIVLNWDAKLLEAIAKSASTPAEASRQMAIVHGAIYDAVNAINRSSGAMFVNWPVRGEASAPAAVAAAAHRALVELFPAQAADFDALLATSLTGIADGLAKADGMALGEGVADAILALRENDGSSSFLSYEPSAQAGQWQPSLPNFAPGVSPSWVGLAPFAINSVDQFRPGAPPALSSAGWAADLNEVQSVGKSDSATRTADQAAIARFWSDGDGTITTAGHWNQIAAQLAADENSSLFETAKMFALLDVALADSAIAAWDAKYQFNLWAPVTAIGAADIDGNDQTTGDANWVPLLPTPADPAYISTTSAMSGAAAAVLSSIFQNVDSLTVSSTFPGSSPRTYGSFSQVALEAAQSGIYGGIDYRSSSEAGLDAGTSLGQFIVDKFDDSSRNSLPRIHFDSTETVVNHNLTVTGRVTDRLWSITSFQAQIDDGERVDVALDPSGEFSFTTTVPLTAGGDHDIRFSVQDSARNFAPIFFPFTIDIKAPTIALTSPAGGTISAGKTLTGTANGTGSALAALSYSFDNGAAIAVSFTSAGAFDETMDLSKLGAGSHLLAVTATDAAGNTTVLGRSLTLPSAIPLTITATNPSNGLVDVGATIHPKISFSRPIDASTLNSSNFFATSSGQRLAASIVPTADGSAAYLFLSDPLPGGSLVQVSVDGSTISAADSTKLDADGNGTSGGTFTFSFTTVSLANLAGTALHGIVADPGADLVPNTPDDVSAGPDGILFTADDIYLHPLGGVKVSIPGQPDSSVISAADGSFLFDSVPGGDVKLLIDGGTAAHLSSDFFFAAQLFDLNIKVAGDNMVRGGSPGVYLPRIPRSSLQSVGASGTTIITADAAAAPNLTASQRGQLSVQIPGGSLVSPDGSKFIGGEAGISTIPASFATSILPPGELQHSFVISVQAPGVSEFDSPLALSFPNVFGARAGTRLDIISFDESSGRAEISGSATVSADGLFVYTDAGQGITHPGLHGLAPPGGSIFATGGPLQPNDYVVVKIGNGIPLRTRTDDAGQFSLFLPPDQNYAMTIFDPTTGRVAHSAGTTPHSGQSINVGQGLVFNASTQIDSDQDGLADDIELVIGTNPGKKDSDGDGLRDSAAIQNGLDANAHRTYPTGIVASLPLAGEANDIVIASSSHLAYVATGSAGLAVVNVRQFDKPIVLGQLDLPGDAVSVAVDARLNIAAVASGPAGLHLVNVADPANPILLQTIGTDARAVVVVEGIAYIATAVGIESYDLFTGEQLQSLPVEGGVVSLAIEGSTIYTMDSVNRLRMIEKNSPVTFQRGLFTAPHGGGKIFVGNGIVYITAADSINGGFSTVDVRHPESPLLLGGSNSQANIPTAGAAIAPNGSGLTVEIGPLDATLGGANVLDVFNTSNLINPADFMRRIVLPGAPNALAISLGIAFVADGAAGLQVVNYAPFDTGGNPPLAILGSPVPDNQPITPGIEVVEGSTLHLPVNVTDDVQLRSLDLLVNGSLITTATAFPFDLKVDLPKMAPGGSIIVAQVRATDTGGNTALSGPLEFDLIRDTTAPSIISISPHDAAAGGPTSRSIRIDFSKSIDDTTLTGQNIALMDSFDHPRTPIDIQVRRDGQTVQLTYDTLSPGSYHVVINTAAIKDRAGNRIAGPNVTTSFTIAQGTILWTNSAGGDWSNPANWDLGRVPNAGDDVYISAAPGATITHSSGSDTVASIRADSRFTLSGGTLAINRQAIFNDALTLSGGTFSGAGSLIANSNVIWSNSVLEGPGLSTFSKQSALAIPPGASPRISSRIVNFSGASNIASSIVLSGSAALSNGGTLNLSGDVGFTSLGGSPTLSNSGSLIKTGGSGSATISIPFTNRGTLAANSGTINLSGGGVSSGRFTAGFGASITLNSTSFSFTGGSTFGGLGMIRVSSGTSTVNAAVTMPNLALDGGTLASVAHANLNITGNLAWTAGSIGPGVSVNISSSASLAIGGNSAKNINSATINNAGTVTWSGNGGISLASSVFNNSGSFNVQNDLSFGGGAGSTFNNSGTVSKSASAGITTFAVTFNNSGTAAAHSGNLRFNFGGVSTGTFTADASANVTFLTTPYALNGGTTFSGDGMVHLTNTVLTVTNFVTARNFSLEGGNIDGPGTLTIDNMLNWSGGSFMGGGITHFATAATVNISGSANKAIDTRTLINEGAIIWAGSGALFTRNGSIFNNFGVLTIQNDSTWNNNLGSISTFNNLGTLIKQTAAGASSFGVTFNNSGTISSQSGTIGLTNGGTSSGNFTAIGAGTINFNGGVHTLTDGASLSGNGVISISAGAVNFDGPDQFDGTMSVSGGSAKFNRPTILRNLNLSTGTFGGVGAVHITGTMNWSGLSILDGTSAGIGSFTIDPGATLNISGSAIKTLTNYNFINAGVATWTASSQIQSFGSTFTNNGTLNIASATGIANLFVDFIQSSQGTLNINISGASTFEQLKITGSASLAGKLNIALNGFVPISGSAFKIVSATSLSGTFDTISGDSALFTGLYDNSALTLLAI
jgi:hypothetical protein